MKSLVLFRLIAVALSCLWFTQAPKIVHTHYLISPEFTEIERKTVQEAIDHFEEQIQCVEFHDSSDGTQFLINKNMILRINKVHRLENNTVGNYRRDLNVINIATYSVTKVIIEKLTKNVVVELDLKKLPKDYTFKVVLHELGHYFNMGANPHPFTDSQASHLAPSVSHSTPKTLFKKDVDFLRTKICENDLEE